MYPMGLRLAGRRVLVVGGGTVAHRRIPRLLDAGADVLLVAPRVHTALQGLAEAGRVTWRRRDFAPSDLTDAWLVLAAADPAVNTEISALAEAARTFCVRADDADAATAWTPAVTGADGLTVATFADADPRRSAALRDAIAAGLADASLSAPRFREPTEPAVPGVTLVGAGPGDPELITVAGWRALGDADVVIADRLAPARLLEDLPGHVEIVDAAKIPYGRQLDQTEITRIMLDRARDGKRVVRLKGGDGFVFGRGGEEMDACLAAGVSVRVIPGVTSALAGPALAGIPITRRELVHEFTVVSGHLAPDDPDSLVDWSALARLRGTIVLLMAVRHWDAIAEALMAGGKPATTLTTAVMEASTSRQRVVHAALSTMSAQAITSPAVIVVGAVAGK
ncbi:MAG: uroporphyrinogen-III C-methyltransferase [Stackebrandtia sp.]